MGIVYDYAFHTSKCLGTRTAHVPVIAYIGLYLQTLYICLFEMGLLIAVLRYFTMMLHVAYAASRVFL